MSLACLLRESTARAAGSISMARVFKPSEFAKLVLIIMLAWYCERSQRQMNTWIRGVILPGLIIASILSLVFIEPDRGTTILLAAVSGSMLLVAGVRWKHILIPASVGAAGLAVSILHDPMRLRRIFSWWNLEQHKDGVGYQAYQAMIALGSGGWTGLGLGNGRQKLGLCQSTTPISYSPSSARNSV